MTNPTEKKPVHFLVIIFFIAVFDLIFAHCAKADDRQSLPFGMLCPDTSKCHSGEKGQWLPSWYARQIAEDISELEYLKKTVDALQKEIHETNELIPMYETQINNFELQVQADDSVIQSQHSELESLRKKSDRRFRWGVASTTIALALTAGIFAAFAIH